MCRSLRVMSLNRCGFCLRGYSVSMTGRLRDDEEASVFGAAIGDLVRCSGGNSQAGVRQEAVLFSAQFNGKLTREHVEELRGA